MKIPFFRPKIDNDTVMAVSKVLRSGWLTTGPKTLEFEETFANYVNAQHAVMLNSGTAALHLALAAIGLKAGDEVITTPYTFAATAEVIEYFNAKPVFVDIREDTLNIDEKLIEKSITSKTRAIIPVHFGGHPCEMDTIMGIARRRGLYVIEDAAHCTPAYYKGAAIGSIGDITCFSFYANKCITTGEGGMAVTDNRKLAQKIRQLRLHGLSRDAINRYSRGGLWKYDITDKGYKYNPTDISAAIGIHQLKKADYFFEARQKIVALYNRQLGSLGKFRLPVELPEIKSSWHIYPVRLIKGGQKKRAELINFLTEKGIGTSVHFIPLHLHSYYKNKYNYKANDFPIAYKCYRGLVTLPVYPGLTAKDIKYIADCLKAFFY